MQSSLQQGDASCTCVVCRHARDIRVVRTGVRQWTSRSCGRGARARVGFFHPLLDSLGLAPPITVLDIHVSGNVRMPLATPSARTMLTTLCGARARDDSTGVFVGYVRSARDAIGQPNAQVRISWSELVIGTDGIRRTTPSVQGQSSDVGGVALCGIPIGAQVVARTWSGT